MAPNEYRREEHIEIIPEGMTASVIYGQRSVKINRARISKPELSSSFCYRFRLAN